MPNIHDCSKLVRSSASIANSILIHAARDFSLTKGKASLAEKIDEFNREVYTTATGFELQPDVDPLSGDFDPSAILNKPIDDLGMAVSVLYNSLSHFEARVDILSSLRNALVAKVDECKSELESAREQVAGGLRQAGFTEKLCPVNGVLAEGPHNEKKFAFLVNQSPITVAALRNLDRAKACLRTAEVELKETPAAKERIAEELRKISKRSVVVA